MVAPCIDLKRRLRNTDNIIRSNRIELASQLHEKYPQDYLDVNTHGTLQRVRPWTDVVSPLRLHTTESQTQTQTQTQTLQPMSVDKILILCVDFPDKPHQVSLETIYNRFFSDIGSSLKNYYKENSYSRYIPHGELYGWYRAPNPSTYYANQENGFGKYPNSAEKLVEDVIELAKNDPNAPIDWQSFDENNNGYVDNLIIVHAGAEAAFTGDLNDLWAHVYVIPNPQIIQDENVWIYAMTSEYLSKPSDPQIIGGDCHEFGHLLGLPDLYDFSDNSNGVGLYSLMGAGSWGNKGATPTHLDAWSKYVLGFSDATVNPTGNVPLTDAETNTNVIKYTTPDPNEYFLIENRQKLLFDAYLPSEGLFIWHINENQKYNDNEMCFMVGLLQADGLKDLENKANYGDSGDPYPGITNNRSFGINTDPGSILCDSTKQKLLITDISDSDIFMAFNSSF
jgi:immune inhibitor A